MKNINDEEEPKNVKFTVLEVEKEKVEREKVEQIEQDKDAVEKLTKDQEMEDRGEHHEQARRG